MKSDFQVGLDGLIEHIKGSFGYFLRVLDYKDWISINVGLFSIYRQQIGDLLGKYH